MNSLGIGGFLMKNTLKRVLKILKMDFRIKTAQKVS